MLRLFTGVGVVHHPPLNNNWRAKPAAFFNLLLRIAPPSEGRDLWPTIGGEWVGGWMAGIVFPTCSLPPCNIPVTPMGMPLHTPAQH